KSEWAPLLLIDFVRYLLFDERAQLIVPGDRVPTSALAAYVPETELAAVIATTSEDYGHHILLPAGECTLVHLVGVTSAELARAKAEAEKGSADGTFVLAEVLRALGLGALTDASRACVTKDARFEQAWKDAVASLGAS